MLELPHVKIGIGLGLFAVIVLGVVLALVLTLHHPKHTSPVMPPTTSTSTFMTDAQAATWATSYPILYNSPDIRQSVAAAKTMQPIMSLPMTVSQSILYKGMIPSDDTRKLIQARVQTPQNILDTVPNA